MRSLFRLYFFRVLTSALHFSLNFESLNKDVYNNSKTFSVDVENFFFSVLNERLFLAVRECMDENGLIVFQNASGVGTDGFIALLKLYLQSTLALFN